MKEKLRKFNKTKAMWYTLIAITVLVALVLLISVLGKQKKTIVDNNSSDLQTVREKVVFDDIKIKINDDIFSHDQINQEVTEQDIISYFRENLRKGDTIIYVSHDVGVQQLLIAKLVTQSGRIYVFNPFEKYNDTINLSAQANKFESRIITKTVAISDKSFSGMLIYKNGYSSNNGVLKGADYVLENGYNALKVRVLTLDELCPNLQNIDFLRVSTINEIPKVIKGAEQLIKRSPKIRIIVDCAEGQNVDYLSDLKNRGFEIYTINKDGSTVPTDLSNPVKSHLVIKRK